MNIYLARGCSAALAYVIASNMAMADLTAQDVWSDWRAYLTSAGYQVSGSEQSSDGALVVSDISLVMAGTSAPVTVTISADKIEFRENGDGTVAIVLPSNMPIGIKAPGPKGEILASVDYSQTGQSMVVSGTPDDLNYDYNASSFGIALASLNVGGNELPSSMLHANVTVTNVVSSTQMRLSDLRSYNQHMTSDSLDYDLAFTDPGTGDGASASGSLAGFGFSGQSAMPLEMDVGNIQAMLQAGFGFNGIFEFAGGQTEMAFSDRSNKFSMSSTSGGGREQVGMNAQSVSYDLGIDGVALTVNTSQLPFPVSLEWAEFGINLLVPVAKSDQPQDFALGLKLKDFATSEMIWGLVDAAAVLPHDPATIVLDLAGKATVLVDLMDPAVVGELNGPDAPGQLNALTIRDLLVSAAGTSLSGAGDFTFNNADTHSFGGLPAPAGSVDLQLVGANGLLDKLIQMGFVSDKDAMGARMMMGMMTVPGDGEDTLKSNIEIGEDGSISANGQRIK